MISLGIAVLIACPLVISPIYTICAAIKHHNQVMRGDEHLPFEEIFENLNHKSLAALNYNNFFIFRRYILAGFILLSTSEAQFLTTIF